MSGGIVEMYVRKNEHTTRHCVSSENKVQKKIIYLKIQNPGHTQGTSSTLTP